MRKPYTNSTPWQIAKLKTEREINEKNGDQLDNQLSLCSFRPCHNVEVDVTQLNMMLFWTPSQFC